MMFHRNEFINKYDDRRNLFTHKLEQSIFIHKLNVVSDYWYRIISLIGGCWCMLTGLTTWLIKGYIGF